MTRTYTLTEHQRCFPELTTAQRQRLGVEPGGRPLKDDGVIGPKTQAGIFLAPQHDHGLVDTMLLLATLNAREEGGNNFGRWPGLFMGEPELVALGPEKVARLLYAEILRWTGRRQGLWCAGCASTAIRLTYGPGQPQSLGARELTRLWARGPGREVSLAESQAGDVIAWRREVPGQPAAGHVGIVAGRANGLLLVLEGNGGRDEGAVGLYGYDLRTGCKRGVKEPQDVDSIARRPDLVA